MNNKSAPYHVHIYYPLDNPAATESLHLRLSTIMESGEIPHLLYAGQLGDRRVGPHPFPQFEIHFTQDVLPSILPIIEASGLTTLVHPLTDDDFAAHSTLAHCIDEPLELDLSAVDPPDMNKVVTRFVKSAF